MTVAGPRISVLMGVHNGERELDRTMESILSQTYEDFEFIVVDDGSTDASADVLARYEKQDSRVSLITQENRGLTQALIVGSKCARGQFLARQDVGDAARPERLRKQLDFLEAHPEVVAVGAGCHRVGPRDEFLGSQSRELSPEQVTAALLKEGAGLPHPVAMIRMDVFRKVGGYRAPFRYAQDSDLWYRLLEHGLLAELPETLLDLRIDVGGISASNRARQQDLAAIARRCYDARQEGRDQSELLRQAESISWDSARYVDRVAPIDPSAAAEFFIGSQLFALKDSRCRAYLRRAIRRHPLWPAAWAKLALSFFHFSGVAHAERNGGTVGS